jgi:rhamnosyltransferase
MMHGTAEELSSGAEVCALVITYHPDAGLPERARRIVAQAGALIVVDNGSSESALAMLGTLAEDSRVLLISNGANLGVATALNVGIAHARQLGFRFVLLLDQDSDVREDMMSTLISVYGAYPEPERLAVVGAGFEGSLVLALAEAGSGSSDGAAPRSNEAPDLAQGSSTDAWQEVESVITSGSLLPLAAHAVIGPFREALFIDYVDMEYCYRARSKGFHVIATQKPIMAHAIGEPTRHRTLWTDKWTTNHSPDRRYYIARNDTLMLREYGHYGFGLWALKSLGRRLRTCRRILLYEESKRAKLGAVAAGYWDGVRGRLGPRRPTGVCPSGTGPSHR